jgi:hypothetical protein
VPSVSVIAPVAPAWMTTWLPPPIASKLVDPAVAESTKMSSAPPPMKRIVAVGPLSAESTSEALPDPPSSVSEPTLPELVIEG